MIRWLRGAGGGVERQDKRAFERLLAREIERARRHRHPVAVLILRTSGHPSTEHLALQLKTLRPADQVFRLDAATHALVCPHAGATAARIRVAERVRSLVDPAELVAVGTAAYPSDAQDGQTLAGCAQSACIAAAARGRGTIFAWHELPKAASGPPLDQVWERLLLGDLPGIDAVRAYLDDAGTLAGVAAGRRLGDRVAASLGLSDLERGALRGALLVYDVGRSGILDAIWEKAGPLSPAERRVVETHPIVGAAMLRGHAPAAPLVPAVLYHHERFDGSGYPDGLKGDQIPLLARIIHVVDAYLAMIADRPYRRARSAEEAVAELWSGAGSQFDPRVVEAAAESLVS